LGGQENTNMEVLLESIGLTSLPLSTAHKHIDDLGYKYNNVKKSYYNDGHYKEENVLYRLVFIKRIFQLEVNQYLWIQLPDKEATRLVHSVVPLAKYIYHSYDTDNYIAMREYHVDEYPGLAYTPKKRTDGLNVVGMNLNWGGVQKKMHDTTLDEGCLGPFQRMFNAGDLHSK
jgi:hypothetical protein